MDLKDIKALIKMVTETDIVEFELEGAEEKIKIKRGSGQEITYVPVQPSAAIPLPSLQPVGALPESTQPSVATTTPVQAEVGQPIASPIVGTMYHAPAPDAPPYVQVGQVVEKGQVLCIVEAMKLMNEIEAEYRCKILKICKDNAQPVEFGETLFLVEPM